MACFYGVDVNRTLTELDKVKELERLYLMIQGDLVNNCTNNDRLDALCDLPVGLDTAMQAAWITKDYIEYMRLTRVLMYRYYDTQANDQAARTLEFS